MRTVYGIISVEILLKVLGIIMDQINRQQDTRMSGRKKAKMSPMKKAVIIAVCVMGAAALVLLGIFIFRTVINPSVVFTLPEATPANTDPAATAGQGDEQLNADMGFMKGRVNILVMGMDASEERFESSREDFRTDTMLLVTINFNTGKVDMITTPRDSYVTVTKATGQLYKVNSAAYFGGGLCESGFQNACDTISGVFGGIPVSYYIGVDMDGMKALVDAMGGVEYDVDLDYTGESGQVYSKGLQHLDSTGVLDYLRVRKGYGTDADRQARQRNMLIAIFKQLANTGQIKNLPAIYQSLSDMVYTNLTLEQICALAVFGTGFDDWNNIGQHTLEGEYHTAYGVYYYLLDQQAKADLVQQIFGVTIGIDEKHDINYVLGDKNNKNAGKESGDEEDPADGEDIEPEPTEPGSTATPPPDNSSATPAPDESSEPETSAPDESSGPETSAPEPTTATPATPAA
jgi:LCP family protein required for cell wall assembly